MCTDAFSSLQGLDSVLAVRAPYWMSRPSQGLVIFFFKAIMSDSIQ